MLITTNSGSFEYSGDEPLLVTLEKNGYIVDYQCRQGYCGACKLKLKQGHVSYRTPPLAYLEKDEILPCCCIVEEDIWIKIQHPKDIISTSLFKE